MALIIGTLFFFGILVVIALGVLFGTFFFVDQQEVRVVERLHKFSHVAEAGLNIKVPFIDRALEPISLKTQQVDLVVTTKTHDNVFVDLHVATRYVIDRQHVFDAFYSLAAGADTLDSFILDAVRTKVPTLDLDGLFAGKDELAQYVEQECSTGMAKYGVIVSGALITEITPDKKVMEAMNEINAQQRYQVAATAKGEAEKVIVVKNAEAQAEAKALQGKGVADERQAIVEGLKKSVKDFADATGGTAGDAMSLVLMTQYFDTIRAIGEGKGTRTIFMPSSPSGVGQIGEEIRASLLAVQK